MLLERFNKINRIIYDVKKIFYLFFKTLENINKAYFTDEDLTQQPAKIFT